MRTHITVIGVVVLMIGLGSLTLVRSQDWHDDFTLWLSAEQQAPHKPRVLINMGRAYETRGMIGEAVTEYQKAVGESFDTRRSVYTQRFTKAAAESNIAHLMVKKGQHEMALAMLDEVIAEWPAFAPAHYNRAVALINLNRCTEAMASYRTARSLDRELPEGLICDPAE